ELRALPQLDDPLDVQEGEPVHMSLLDDHWGRGWEGSISVATGRWGGNAQRSRLMVGGSTPADAALGHHHQVAWKIESQERREMLPGEAQGGGTAEGRRAQEDDPVELGRRVGP